MIEGEHNRLINTNKWLRAMNQTSTELSNDFTKLFSLSGLKIVQLEQMSRVLPILHHFYHLMDK